MKALKILKYTLGIIGFISFFALTILTGAEFLTSKIFIAILIALVGFGSGTIGFQLVHNEIEYRERMEKRENRKYH